jgi:hypothetical protein
MDDIVRVPFQHVKTINGIIARDSRRIERFTSQQQEGEVDYIHLKFLPSDNFSTLILYSDRSRQDENTYLIGPMVVTYRDIPYYISLKFWLENLKGEKCCETRCKL